MKMPLTAKDILDSDGKHLELRESATQRQRDNAADLANRVNQLLLAIGMTDRPRVNDGLRAQNATYGAKRSAHKEGKALDFADIDGSLKKRITPELLLKCGLRMEHPDYCNGWVHLDTRAPSGRIFKP